MGWSMSEPRQISMAIVIRIGNSFFSVSEFTCWRNAKRREKNQSNNSTSLIWMRTPRRIILLEMNWCNCVNKNQTFILMCFVILLVDQECQILQMKLLTYFFSLQLIALWFHSFHFFYSNILYFGGFVRKKKNSASIFGDCCSFSFIVLITIEIILIYETIAK